MLHPHYKVPLIAFAGYAGAGKDEAAKPLIEAGYRRCCFGDIIKRQVEPLVRRHFGFSALTSDRAEKERIRRTLEAWGEDNYAGVMFEFFRELELPAVNTRLVRVREAREWKKRGGVIWCIQRLGCDGATEWEQDRMRELWAEGAIDDVIDNNSTVDVLHWEIGQRAGIWANRAED
jgi:dephospho-CoA kinase